MGKMSREKGKRGERECAALLTEHGFPARRAQQYKGTGESGDLICPRLERLGVHNEVKRCEQLALAKWFEQCDADIRSGDAEEMNWSPSKQPLVMHKKNGGEWFATMRLEDFLAIVGDLDKIGAADVSTEQKGS